MVNNLEFVLTEHTMTVNRKGFPSLFLRDGKSCLSWHCLNINKKNWGLILKSFNNTKFNTLRQIK